MDIRQTYQIETIKAQCNAIAEKGCSATFHLNPWESSNPVTVTIFHEKKKYYFSDPDLEVIIRQICTLHEHFNKEEDSMKKFVRLMEAKYGKIQNR